MYYVPVVVGRKNGDPLSVWAAPRVLNVVRTGTNCEICSGDLVDKYGNITLDPTQAVRFVRKQDQVEGGSDWVSIESYSKIQRYVNDGRYIRIDVDY